MVQIFDLPTSTDTRDAGATKLIAALRGIADELNQVIQAVQPATAAPNLPPLPVIAVTASLGLTVSLSGAGSTDPDGTVVKYVWDLGDGTSSTAPLVTHVYATAGTYTVGLTVTDDDGLSNATTRTVTVTAPSARPTGAGYTGFETLTGATMNAKLASAATSSKVTFLPGTYSFNDFAVNNPGAANTPYNGLAITNLGLIGSGVGSTIIQMAANTSTYPKSNVPPTASGTTNPLNLIRSQNSGAVELAGFHLRGTTQDAGGCYYNGLRVTGAGVKVHDLKISGIPGYSSVNPGETFAMNIAAVNGFTLANVEVDGKNSSTGAAVTASAVGFNSCTGGTSSGTNIHDVKWCKAFALWQHKSGSTWNGGKSDAVAFHFGFEQSSGTYTINDYSFGTATRADIHLANNGSYNGGALAKVVINRPVLPAGKSKIKVLLSTNELGSPNLQKQADVKVYDGSGNDISSSILTFVTSA